MGEKMTYDWFSCMQSICIYYYSVMKLSSFQKIDVLTKTYKIKIMKQDFIPFYCLLIKTSKLFSEESLDQWASTLR